MRWLFFFSVMEIGAAEDEMVKSIEQKHTTIRRTKRSSYEKVVRCPGLYRV